MIGPSSREFARKLDVVSGDTCVEVGLHHMIGGRQGVQFSVPQHGDAWVALGFANRGYGSGQIAAYVMPESLSCQ